MGDTMKSQSFVTSFNIIHCLPIKRTFQFKRAGVEKEIRGTV